MSSVFISAVAVIGALALAYVLVRWLPRWGSWGYRVVFWTPATLSAGVLLLGLIFLIKVTGDGAAAGEYTPDGIVAWGMVKALPALTLNLSLFVVPRAIGKAHRGVPVVTTVLTSAGVLFYGILTVVFARRYLLAWPFSYGANTLFTVVGFFLLYVVGLVHIVRVSRQYLTARPTGAAVLTSENQHDT
jgi:hypothetical protein